MPVIIAGAAHVWIVVIIYISYQLTGEGDGGFVIFRLGQVDRAVRVYFVSCSLWIRKSRHASSLRPIDDSALLQVTVMQRVSSLVLVTAGFPVWGPLVMLDIKRGRRAE